MNDLDPIPENVGPTAEQWVSRFLNANDEVRLKMAEHAIKNGRAASTCFLQNHDGLLHELSRAHELIRTIRVDTWREFQDALIAAPWKDDQ